MVGMAWGIAHSAVPDSGRPPKPENRSGGVIELHGKTVPVPGRMARIATTVLHPVERVLVAPGDRVEEGQPLVELDQHGPAAEVRARTHELAELSAGLARLRALPREQERAEARAELEAARALVQKARQCHDRFERLRSQDAISLHQHQEAHADLLRAEAEERAAAAHLECLIRHPVAEEIAEMEARVAAAQSELEVAQAELEHYTVRAAISGVVARLDVYPGTVTRPGMADWGEILELSEIEVRCELPPAQAEVLALDQETEVIRDGPQPLRNTGRVVRIGRLADPQTGLVPVWVRLSNPQERLGCNENVTLHLNPSTPAVASTP